MIGIDKLVFLLSPKTNNHVFIQYTDVPGKPDIPDVTDVDRTHIGISWSPPESDGGSPITSYLIEKKDTSSTRWIKIKETIIDTEFTIRDLTEGQTYEFRVAAVNKAGPGPFSEPTEPKLCKPPYGMLLNRVDKVVVRVPLISRFCC